MISRTAQKELKQTLEDRIAFDVPMSKHTSLRVGGPADALTTPGNRSELRHLLGICHRHSLPHYVIGAGFNLLVRDGGIEGVVINLKKMRRHEQRSDTSLFAEAGVSHASITRFCIEQGLSGLEFAAGIPGTVGGWLRMNAGIPDREQKDVVREIEIVSADGGKEERLEAAQLGFGYRELRGLPQGSPIVSALFHVEPSSREKVQQEVDRLLAHRAQTQPLDVPSCGSVFRNPRGDHAGRLIDAASLGGERIGGAEISDVHANFIANRGGATAADVLALMDRARKRVLEQSGIRLETEVRIVGRESK